MRNAVWLICVVVGILGIANGQATGKRVTGDRVLFPPTKGRAILHRDLPPGYAPESIRDLVQRSNLILDGFVQQIFPSRVVGQQRLETDILIRVDGVLKGLETIKMLIITQVGGSVGEFTLEPADYTLMKTGERYILFLESEARTELPDLGTVRYRTTGAWTGMFARIDENGVVQKAAARLPQDLSGCIGKPVADLKAEVATLVGSAPKN